MRRRLKQASERTDLFADSLFVGNTICDKYVVNWSSAGKVMILGVEGFYLCNRLASPFKRTRVSVMVV